MPAHPFRFAAKRCYLTYSDIGSLTKEDIYYTVDERWPIRYYVLGEEIHPTTGGRHVHCLIEFRTRVDTTDVTCFDVHDGVSQYHPNIQTIKRGQAHWDRILEYCTKEDPCPLANIELKPTWGEMMSDASSADEWLRLVKRHYPREYALNLQRLEYTAEKNFPTFGPNTICTFSVSPNATMTSALNLLAPLPATTTVVIGPSGCGKTTWAKIYAPKPCLFVRHLDTLKDLGPHHMSIIFDDLDFRHLPHPTQKYIVDQTDVATIHLRYRVATIPTNITRIFTANEYPFMDDGEHGQAIRRRLNLINLFIQ